MNRFVLFLSVATFATSAVAQTPAAGPAMTMKPASSTAKPATAASAGTAPEPQPWIKLPAGVPRVVHGLVKMPFALRYEDVKVGTGAAGETGKLWHLKYTGWRAADGVKFDSWDDHKQPKMGSDGKPVMGPDGKPVLGDPVPIAIPQGMGRVIPGFDYGLEGMKIGGKRRIFIPWQMAYGTRSIPDRPDHPGIPAKSDLIFDVELVDQTDLPQPPQMTRPGGMPGNHPMPGGTPPHPGASAPPAAAPSAPATQPAGQTTAPAATAPTQPTAPAQPATTQPAQTQPK
jgi:peptidylprolyl isomerase